MTTEDQTDNPFDLNFFKENKFLRKTCVSCGKFFWTLDLERKTCGDPPCDSYSFIGNPAGKAPMSTDMVRKAFLDYFEGDHKKINPYPVVPRWRDDVLLVNASIYDFQPHVTSGIVPPPGNPLVMSQPSIRMNDLDLVGKSGRHLTCFEMLCHDSFNRNGKEYYWKEGTVSRCHGFFTEVVGVKGIEITYKENPWLGGGNAGNALEVFVRGLEVGTLVFMDLKEDPEGSIVLENVKYSKMDLTVVDTGYGLERISWVTQGSPTVYDSTYKDVVDYILKNSGLKVDEREDMGEITQIYSADPDRPAHEIEMELQKFGKQKKKLDWDRIENIRQAYILGDHARSILHISRDYVIPSNVKVGYLFRLLIRRSFRAIDLLKFNGNLMDIVKLQMENLKGIVDDFPEEFLMEILWEEREKYYKSLEKGTEVVNKLLRKKGSIDTNDLELLYDSYGLVPDFVSQLLKEKGINLTIPMNFHENIVMKHSGKKEIEDRAQKIPQFKDLETRTLYYDDSKLMEFTALVLASVDNKIVTNQTAFYPTGGGQPYDLGYFQLGSKKFPVKNVYKEGIAIIHEIEGNIEKGQRIKGVVDMMRRRQLMVHHSATHLLLGTMRHLLGEQVWQAGAQKGVESSRIDITYNKKIDEEIIEKIEHECLLRITENRKVIVKFMNWNQAIEKYGFRLFEGGVPLSQKLRVAEIEGVDVEGCGGTHLSSTGEIGFLKIMRVEGIQEGIYRITFAAGEAALNYVEKQEKEMNKIKEIVRSTEDTVDKVQKSLTELLLLREEVSALNKQVLSNIFETAEIHKTENVPYSIITVQSEKMLKLAIPMALNAGRLYLIKFEKTVTFVSKDKSTIKKLLTVMSDSKIENVGSVFQVQSDSIKMIN